MEKLEKVEQFWKNKKSTELKRNANSSYDTVTVPRKINVLGKSI